VALKLVISWSSNRTRPPVGLTSPISANPVVDFPHPLSPTSERVSPRPRVKLTPSTALTDPTWRLSTPARMGKWTSRSSTARRGIVAGCIVMLPAGGHVAGRFFDKGRTFFKAPLGGTRTARRKGAALGQVPERWHGAGNVGQPPALGHSRARHRAHQATRVG